MTGGNAENPTTYSRKRREFSGGDETKKTTIHMEERYTRPPQCEQEFA